MEGKGKEAGKNSKSVKEEVYARNKAGYKTRRKSLSLLAVQLSVTEGRRDRGTEGRNHGRTKERWDEGTKERRDGGMK